MIADEPAEVGGHNSGPSPHGLLAAALASCTSMTLRMYANHKQLPLESARVDVTHEKARDEDGQVDKFHRRITLTGTLDADTRARMIEIADRCPVHRTLYGKVIVTNELS